MKLIKALFISSLLFIISCQPKSLSKGYWLWAGVDPTNYIEKDNLYIYQGYVSTYNERISFQKRGLFPHPMESKNITLVFRLDSMVDQDELANLILGIIFEWELHKVKIDAIQLDFDSSTKGLENYNNYLKVFREKLPAQFRLSITGLCDWIVSAKNNSFDNLIKTVDEIVIQLYSRRNNFDNYDYYLKRLKKKKVRYKLGLIMDEKQIEIEEKIKKLKNCDGIVYFVL